MVEAENNDGGGFDSSDQSEDEIVMTREQLDQLMLDAVKSNDVSQCEEALAKGANAMAEKNGWNPLLWAACNGNEDIVRLLIKHDAHRPYMATEEEEKAVGDGQEEEEDDPFKKADDPAKTGKYTPMHWASYHGHYKVVWILMKANMSPLIKDMHGNNAVHQAAANSQTKVLKCFMSFGVDVHLKNARKHAPIDLATHPETRTLINRGIQTTHCSGKKCGGSKFDFRNIQYYCENCGKFWCLKCSQRDWVYEDKDSRDKERPVCLCDNCHQHIQKAEGELASAIEQNDFDILDKVLTQIQNDKTDIDVKLLDRAEVTHLKLQKQLEIKKFMKSVDHVDVYKTILKSVKVLNDMEKNAKKLGVELDPELELEINQCTHRLISERNLRFEMENMYISGSNQETVDKLQELIKVATETNVEQSYLDQASNLNMRMNDNIEARKIMEDLVGYEEREYPEADPVDPKTGKPLKPKDDKNKKKKKRKKEPVHPIPEWAIDLENVVAATKRIEQLAARANELALEKEFLAQVDYQVKRFKKEIKFRRDKEIEEREEAEARLAAKKKKKK